MMKLMKKQLSNQRGVTLIELLAVIVILGILAAVAVPAVMSQIGDAKDTGDDANIAIMRDAIERYAVMNNAYPTVTSSTSDITSLINVLNSGTGAPFINDFPTVKSDGSEWDLVFQGTSTTIVIGIE